MNLDSGQRRTYASRLFHDSGKWTVDMKNFGNPEYHRCLELVKEKCTLTDLFSPLQLFNGINSSILAIFMLTDSICFILKGAILTQRAFGKKKNDTPIVLLFPTILFLYQGGAAAPKP
ncbi:uncharacterized protein PGTG_02596 [Puccinia graminis f. sp. tritici CRL 75-36-700-3]|uniref:Uncharacterized protein n=1 Tax=Puccinia graminis f. sp. tritici (strain CRL 75-36-700-3 / race SCCL) TaxID=418459 RepID=E3JVT0_PUCGT|nr:uncharacterized protein PGTG_02596 [Puccinia graminis f. sp. tritici CRL 75-36-700-3]EFP76155.1 hypothetical protein PGTG_02596 [Puccinia graminis f. sp. tritici CRL 75-36-700-3]